MGEYIFKGSPDSPDKAVHWHRIYTMKGTTGVWVGHAKEDGIVVQAKTKDGVIVEAQNALTFLWMKFPEIHDKRYPRHVSLKETLRLGFSVRQEIQPILVRPHK